MKKSMLLLCVVFIAAMSFGYEALWTNKSTSVQSWFNPTNWNDLESGELPTALPTNVTDSVRFPDFDSTVRKVSLFPNPTSTDYEAVFSVGSIAGGKYWQMVLSKGDYTFGHRKYTIEIGDVNAFTGSWTSVTARQKVRLTAGEGTQTFKNITPDHQFPIEVASPVVTANVERLTGNTGMLVKSGPGFMRVQNVHDASLSLQIEEGEVQIDGAIGDDDDVFAKAVVHFDASRTETLQGYEDDLGRVRITNWLNRVSGSTNHAKVPDNRNDTTASHIKNVGVPVLMPDASGTGLPMLDFGYPNGNTKTPDADLPATAEPTNCLMTFTRLTNVREVFAVFDHDGLYANSGCPVLGDNEDYAFSCNQVDILKHASAYPAIRDGEVYLNGSWEPAAAGSDGKIDWPKDSYSSSWKDLTLLNVKAAEDLRLGCLASDRLYKGASGGIRIGEVILFTNVLSAAERRDVNRYLMRKWFGKYPQQEFKLVHTADGSSISVPAGRTVKLGTVCVDGALVKKGAGTLEIERLYPSDAAVSVEGGEVRFVQKFPLLSADAPAGTPQFWYDADAPDAFNIVDGVVTNWYDCRSEYRTERKASKYADNKVTAMPLVDTESVPGRTVLYFPENAAMTMPGRLDNAYVYQQEIMMAFAFTTEEAAESFNHIAAGGYTTVRGKYKFVDPSSASDVIGGEVFTIDGIPVDPVAPDDGTTFETGKWYVVSAAYSGNANVAKIGTDASRNKIGCIKVGEIITYATLLTDDERRDTVAYLMKKWLGKNHPDVVSETTPELEYVTDGPVMIGADSDIDYASLSGGNGTLVKTGLGSSSVFCDLDDGFETLKVEAGSLTIGKPGYQDTSAFHFDAMSPESYTTYVSENADGTLQTNVSMWADVRTNGITAVKPGHNAYLNFTNPVLVKVEMRPGVWHPALDFLKYFGRSDDNKAGTYLPGAGFHLSTPFANIVEAHVVFADRSSDMRIPLFTAKDSIKFNRGGNGHLFASEVDATETKSDMAVQKGYIALDNEPASPSTSLPLGFHLVSIVPTNGLPINTIGAERNIHGGGSLQSELIGFTTKQTEAQRNYLQAHLMHKWFDGAKPVWTNETPLASMSVAPGAVLNVNGEVALSVAGLYGSGTINAEGIVGVSELELDCESGEPLVKTISGDLGFADAVTLTLDGDLRRLACGEYPLVEVSGSIFNFRPETWTIVSNIKQSRDISVKSSDGALVLSVAMPGMSIIVR